MTSEDGRKVNGNDYTDLKLKKKKKKYVENKILADKKLTDSFFTSSTISGFTGLAFHFFF